MTAVEIYQDRTPAVVDHRNAAVQSLTAWAQSAQAASQVAAELVRTSFVPAQFKGKAAEATAAILAGLECGLQPMAALRSFDIIQGVAAPRAMTLRAIAQSFGHEIVVEESTATRCKVKGRRRDSSEWQTVTWTIDRAQGLGLLSKDNWKKQPQAMLQARATSEMARLIAADAILGIGYSSEEIADGAGAGVEVPAITTADPSTPDAPTAPTAPAGSKRMSRRKPPAEPPPAEEEIADGEVVEDEPVDADGVTDAQIKKMAVSFREQGITERADRLDYITAIIGREVGSSKELTKDEASKVIDSLETPEEPY